MCVICDFLHTKEVFGVVTPEGLSSSGNDGLIDVPQTRLLEPKIKIVLRASNVIWANSDSSKLDI